MSSGVLGKVRGMRGNANASPAVIGLALIVLMAFIGWLAWNNLLKPPGPPPFSAQELKNRATLAELAKKCSGNFSKLSPEDQAIARKMAGGMAGRAISMLYKNPDM
jgi:hypothetical protein